jgi:hypothetical protein
VERIRIETAKGLGRRGYCGSAGDIFLSTVPPRLDGKERNRADRAITGKRDPIYQIGILNVVPVTTLKHGSNTYPQK